MTEPLPDVADRPQVLLLSSSFVAVTRLRLAIMREGSLACTCVSTVASGRELLDHDRIAALVLESEDVRGEPTAELVRRARARDPRRPVVALLRRTAGWTASAISLVAERPAHVASVEELDEGAILRVIAPPDEDRVLVDDLWSRLDGAVPPPLHAVVRAALSRSRVPLTVEGIARAGSASQDALAALPAGGRRQSADPSDMVPPPRGGACAARPRGIRRADRERTRFSLTHRAAQRDPAVPRVDAQ